MGYCILYVSMKFWPICQRKIHYLKQYFRFVVLKYGSQSGGDFGPQVIFGHLWRQLCLSSLIARG